MCFPNEKCLTFVPVERLRYWRLGLLKRTFLLLQSFAGSCFSKYLVQTGKMFFNRGSKRFWIVGINNWLQLKIVVDKIEGDILELNLQLYRLRRDIDEQIEPVLISSGSDKSDDLVRASSRVGFFVSGITKRDLRELFEIREITEGMVLPSGKKVMKSGDV